MAHRFYCETPSYGAGVGTEAFLKEGFCTLVAEKGLGPEGSKPAVNNHRSWGRGAEASPWPTVQWKRLRPKACLLLIIRFAQMYLRFFSINNNEKKIFI